MWVGPAQGALGLGVSHAISSLPSSAGRRVPECGEPCPWVWDSPILGQTSSKLKGNQTKTPHSLPAQRSFSAFSKVAYFWPLPTTYLAPVLLLS